MIFVAIINPYYCSEKILLCYSLGNFDILSESWYETTCTPCTNYLVDELRDTTAKYENRFFC